jgi:hypothetical protein
MKQIQPVSIWYNGSNIPATLFLLVCNSDNLSSTANFYFALYSSSEIKLSEGNLLMTGFDYEAYSSSPDSNAYAYQWATTQLNLTLV